MALGVFTLFSLLPPLLLGGAGFSLWQLALPPEQRRLPTIVLKTLVIIAINIIAAFIGFMIGFMITFSACYKSTCSEFESNAWLMLPAMAVLVTVFVSVAIAKKLPADRAPSKNASIVMKVIGGLFLVLSGLALLGLTASLVSNVSGY